MIRYGFAIATVAFGAIFYGLNLNLLTLVMK